MSQKVAPKLLRDNQDKNGAGATGSVAAEAARRIEVGEFAEIELDNALQASPVAVSRSGSGNASNHCVYSSCKATSSATASPQRCGRERRSAGRRQRVTGAPA